MDEPESPPSHPPAAQQPPAQQPASQWGAAPNPLGHPGVQGGMTPGHLPCPRCGQPVLPAAPLCPNCGSRIRGGRAPIRMTGAWILMGGLAICVISVAVFFFGCVNALGNTGSSAMANDWWAPVSGVALLIGLLTMLVGFVVIIVQAVRR